MERRGQLDHGDKGPCDGVTDRALVSVDGSNHLVQEQDESYHQRPERRRYGGGEYPGRWLGARQPRNAGRQRWEGNDTIRLESLPTTVIPAAPGKFVSATANGEDATTLSMPA